MFGIGTTELLVILFIILLVFGSKKLPELAQGLGKGMREFKKATSEIQDELDLNAPLEKSTPKVDEKKEVKKETDHKDKQEK